MMPALDFLDLSFETLAPSHDLSTFDCGDNDLNGYLQNDALESQNERLATTKVVLLGGKVIAYLTCSCEKLVLSDLDGPTKRQLENMFPGRRDFPAVAWRNFAIDREFQGSRNIHDGMSLARFLLFWLLDECAGSFAAVRFLIVPAKPERAALYARFKFSHNKLFPSKKAINWMRLDLVRD